MSLEAARTRARLQAAYLAQLLPETSGETLMGYRLAPIHSPHLCCVTPQSAGAGVADELNMRRVDAGAPART